MKKKSPMVQNGYIICPITKNKKFNCIVCDYHTSNRKDFLKHCSTKKHDTKWVHLKTGNLKYFHCNECDFISCEEQDLEKHFQESGHENLSLEVGTNLKPLDNMERPYICEFCNKAYKFSSGLYRHQKKCKKATNIKSEGNPELMKLLIKSTENNNKLCEKLVELEAKQQVIQNTINQTIHNNQKLNINLFLNNECKNAMNIGEFVDKIQLTLEDLIYSQQHGYIKGITNIFVKNLEDLEPTERPIHSIEDKKKRQFYVKDETGWDCDKKDEKINQSIDSVTKKQINKIKEWESTRPDWNTTEQGIEDYMQMIQTIMGGSTQIEREKNIKLIKKELTENVDINEACNSLNKIIESKVI